MTFFQKKRWSALIWSIVKAIIIALVAVFLLHPALELMHLFRSDEPFQFLPALKTFTNVFKAEFLVTNLGVALLGAMVVLGLDRSPKRKEGDDPAIVETPEALKNLIQEGEGDQLEFKSSLRWDRKQGKVNKALEFVIMKTICGLMNHRGGILLIGIDDDGQVLGIEADYPTLRKPDTDAFEQKVVSLISQHLGGQNVPGLHSSFIEYEGQTVAVLHIEPRPEPVFCKTNGIDRYYLRTGNATRELDTREALAHVRENERKGNTRD